MWHTKAAFLKKTKSRFFKSPAAKTVTAFKSACEHTFVCFLKLVAQVLLNLVSTTQRKGREMLNYRKLTRTLIGATCSSLLFTACVVGGEINGSDSPAELKPTAVKPNLYPIVEVSDDTVTLAQMSKEYRIAPKGDFSFSFIKKDCNGDAQTPFFYLGDGFCDPSLDCEGMAHDLGDCSSSEFSESCVRLGEDDIRCQVGWFYPGLGRMGCIESRDGYDRLQATSCLGGNFSEIEDSCESLDEDLLQCTFSQKSFVNNQIHSEHIELITSAETYQHKTIHVSKSVDVAGEVRSEEMRYQFSDERKLLGSEDFQMNNCDALGCTTPAQQEGPCWDSPCEGEPLDALEELTLRGCNDLEYPASYLSDGACDRGLNCGMNSFDGGDCKDYEFVDDCMGNTWVLSGKASNLLGDGICQEKFDCAKHRFDGGDCDGEVRTHIGEPTPAAESDGSSERGSPDRPIKK